MYQIRTKKTWGETLQELSNTMELWGVRASDWMVSGYSNARLDRAVTVQFRHPSGKEIKVQKSDQERPQDNLRAIYLALEDLRMIERRGLADLVGTVLLQLNPASHLVESEMALGDAYARLGLSPNATREIVDSVYRTLSKSAHPDGGGTGEGFQELQRAYQTIVRNDAITAQAAGAR